MEDTAALALRYTNGMIARRHCAYAFDRGDDHFFTLCGTLGWVRWENNGPTITVRSTHPAWSAASNRTMTFAGDELGGYGGAVGIAVFRDFTAGFRDGAPPPFTTNDVLRVLEVIHAAHESSRTGQSIGLSVG